MTQTQKEIKKFNDEFNSLHTQLLDKGEYDLANNIAEVYWRVQAPNFKEGIEFIKKLQNDHKQKL